MRRVWWAGLFLALCALPATAETGLELTGRVEAEGGTSLAGARVSLTPLEPVVDRLGRLLGGGTAEPVTATLTDETGRFALPVPTAGLWHVTVEAKGFMPRVSDFTPMTETRELGTVELTPSTTLAVRATDPDGTPLAGAVVLVESDRSRRFRGFGQSWSTPARIGLTGDDGRVTFERGDRERVRLVAFREDRVVLERRGVLGRSVKLKLTRGSERALRIVRADGSPAAGARLELDSDPLVLSRADDEGILRVVVPTEGTAFDVVDEGLVLWTGTVEPAMEPDAAPQDIRLSERSTMAGRVIDAKTREPLAGAVVWDMTEIRIAAISDGSGQFALQGPASHRLEIASGAIGYLKPGNFEFPLNGDGRPGPTIALDPAAELSGQVVDANGVGVAGANVSMSKKLSGGMMRMEIGMMRQTPEAVTDEQGRFRITAIDPDLDYDIKATAEGYAPASQAVGDLQPYRTVADVKLTLDAGRAIRGNVVDEDGNAIGGVTLTATASSPSNALGGGMIRMGGEEPDAAEGASDDDGGFAVAGLPSGKFDLSTERSGFAPHTVPGIDLEGAEDVDVGSITLLPGESLEGLVLDTDGAPIEGAEVMLTEASPMNSLMMGMPFGEPGQADATADPNGWFAVHDLGADKKYTLTANRPGFVNAQVDGISLPRSEPVELRLEPSSRLAGVVLDTSGEPIAGARVNMMRTRTVEGGGMALQVAFAEDTTTDVEGRFAFEEQEPGKASLTATASGYQETRLADLVIPKGADLDDVELELAEGSILQGRVLTPDGRPAIGATVGKVSEGRGFGPRMGGDAPVDGDGYYRLEGLAPGELSIQAQHGEYPRVAKDVELRTGVNALNLEFKGGQEVSGRVVDSNGKPVPAASVQAIQPSEYWSDSETRTAANGDFTLPGVQDGEYTLTVSAEGYASSRDQKITVAGQPVAGLEIVLDPGTSIVGTISGLEENEYRRVTIRSMSGVFDFDGTAVDHEGRFRMDHVSPGEHEVVGTLADSARRASARVTIEPGMTDVPVELVFDRGVTLGGTVHQGGTPIGGAMISASAESRQRVGWSQTDSNGVFSIDGLLPGSYELTVREFRSGLAHTETVEVTTSREVEIEIPSAALRGTVVDTSDRQPLAGVHVVLAATGETPRGFMPLHSATTDAEGKFELPGIADGAWELSAEKQGYAASKKSVQVQHDRSQESLRMELDPTEGVSLEVRLPTGGAPDEVRLAVMSGESALVRGTYSTGENGSVRVSTVPPGQWDMVVSAPGTAAGTFRVQAPGPRVPVQLRPATTLTIEVPALSGTERYATVRLSGSDGVLYRGLGWSGRPQSSWQMRGGRLDLTTLPPGAWTVTVEGRDGRRWSGTTNTAQGAPASLVLESGD